MSQVLETVLQKFGAKAVSEVQANSQEKCLLVEKKSLKKLLQFVKEEESVSMNYLSEINAADYPEREKRFDLNYHLYSTKNKEWLHLKVQIAENEEIESISDLWEGAFYPETEIYDLFGISFKNNAFEKRLFLPEDFIGFPLRKDFVNPWEEITFK